MDDSPDPTLPTPIPAGLWLGTVVPKRHARRSVTRNLLKRGIRTAVSLNSHVLDKGLWVVRLRAPFDKSAFPSAASMSLQAAAALELAQAIRQAAEPARRRRPAAVRHA